jgi:hypothetical protein
MQNYIFYLSFYTNEEVSVESGRHIYLTRKQFSRTL